MQDETTPQDAGAMPPASDGSVKCDPLGWAVVNKNGDAVRFAQSFLTLATSATQDDEIVPLYRQPTLSDDERESIRYSILSCEADIGTCSEEVNIRIASRHRETLLGLLERTK